MARQIDVNVCALMSRCPVRVAASARTAAKRDGVTLSAYIARLIKNSVVNISPDEESLDWMARRISLNEEQRKRADELTAMGKYKTKHPQKRGRPPKVKTPQPTITLA